MSGPSACTKSSGSHSSSSASGASVKPSSSTSISPRPRTAPSRNWTSSLTPMIPSRRPFTRGRLVSRPRAMSWNSRTTRCRCPARLNAVVRWQVLVQRFCCEQYLWGLSLPSRNLGVMLFLRNLHSALLHALLKIFPWRWISLISSSSSSN